MKRAVFKSRPPMLNGKDGSYSIEVDKEFTSSEDYPGKDHLHIRFEGIVNQAPRGLYFQPRQVIELIYVLVKALWKLRKRNDA